MMQSSTTLSKPNHKIKAYSAVALSALLYGGNTIAGKVIAGHIPPASLACIRSALGFLVLLILAWPQIRYAPRPNRQELLYLLFLSLLGISVPYTTFLIGLNHTSGMNAAIIFATSPIVTNTILAVAYKYKPSRLQTYGIIASFSGLIFIFTQGRLSNLLNFSLGTGDLILFFNVLSVATFTILGQRFMKKYSPVITSIYVLAWGTIVLLPLGAWQLVSYGWHLSISGCLLVIFMGAFVSGLSFFLNNYGISKIGSGQASIIGNASPIFSIFLCVILLGESLSFYHWIGCAFVFGGILLSLYQQFVSIHKIQKYLDK